MSHSYVSNLMHCTFSTKDRFPHIDSDLEQRLWLYLGGIARENRIKALAIGGTADHVHALLSLPGMMSFAKAVQLIKGGSSKWVHDTFPQYKKFEWQEGYGAFSVSASQISKTTAYINNQKEHHRKKSFQRSFLNFSKSMALNTIRVTYFESQPSASRTADVCLDLVPPMNRWAIVIRPLRGLVVVFPLRVDASKTALSLAKSHDHPLGLFPVRATVD